MWYLQIDILFLSARACQTKMNQYNRTELTMWFLCSSTCGATGTSPRTTPESSATTPKLAGPPSTRAPSTQVEYRNIYEFVIQTQVEDRIQKLDFSYRYRRRKSRTKKEPFDQLSCLQRSTRIDETDSFSRCMESYIFILIADVLNELT